MYTSIVTICELVVIFMYLTRNSTAFAGAVQIVQSGVVPGNSTTNQLVEIYDKFCKVIDEGKEVHAVFCDVRRAFDRV